MKKQYKEYNKLIRDNIPEMINKNHPGKDVVFFQHPDNRDYGIELINKMNEELSEYLESTEEQEKMEELSDVLEVFMTILDFNGFTFQDIETLRINKKENRGGFDKRLFLIKVEK